MMEWKIMGIIMIIPTMLVALHITAKMFKDKHDEFWVNLAIVFWISANSYWMICEFINKEEIKNYAGIFFCLGIISVLLFYAKQILKKENQ